MQLWECTSVMLSLVVHVLHCGGQSLSGKRSPVAVVSQTTLTRRLRPLATVHPKESPPASEASPPYLSRSTGKHLGMPMSLQPRLVRLPFGPDGPKEQAKLATLASRQDLTPVAPGIRWLCGRCV